MGASGLFGVDQQRSLVIRTDRNGNLLWQKSFGAANINDCTEALADADGGLVITGLQSSTVGILSTYLKKMAADGREVWTKDYADFLWAYHLSRLPNGQLTLVSNNYDGGRNREWLRVDSLGNQLVRKKINTFSPNDEMAAAVATSDGGLALLGDRTVSNNKDFHLVKVDANGDLYANQVSGKVFFDKNATCAFDGLDTPLAGWLVKAENADRTIWAFTDSLGGYNMGVDSSIYRLSIVRPNRYWAACRDSIYFSLNSRYPRETVDFAVKSTVSCPLLEIDVATPQLRRCFENTYFVNYCNRGTTTSRGATVRVVLDKYLIFNAASVPLPLSNRRGDTLFFNVPNLETNQCQSFTFKATVRCDSTFIGQTHCVEAHIFPDSICQPTVGWSGASIAVSGSCQRDSVAFLLKNVGTGNTSQPVNYIVIEDDIIFIQSIVSLPAGAVQSIKIPARGSTYRLVANQEPNHPSAERHPTAVVEGCRVNTATPLSIGFVTQFDEDDGDPFESIDCHQNIGAFDPNDKQAHPQGIGSQHFIDEDTEIDYTVRYQNTGTDTAFTVVVRDTLSAFLDVTTLRLGARSHNYLLDIVEGKVLKFTFNKINLPDSFRNVAASQGFLKFSIELKKGVPFNTRITNQAAIFFDFNSPILTNRTFHTRRKPERYSSRNLTLCDNQFLNGRLYTNDARVYDTMRLTAYDSIIINILRVLPTFKKSVDTTLRKGQPLNGIVYQRDTTITTRFTAKNGCDSVVTYKLRLLTPTQDWAASGIKMYPNPFSTQTTIELPPQYSGDFELKIYDARGSLRETRRTTSPIFTFEKGTLTQGLYFLTITNNKNVIVVGQFVISD